MKTSAFIVTSMALGVMSGVTAMHYFQVGKMVERGLPTDDRPKQPASQPVIEQRQNNQPVPVKFVASDVPKAQKPVVSFHSPRTEREDALLELLAAMRKEQQAMRKQLAETNREMSELTFRVDTHSDSFKPLQTNSQRPQLLDRRTSPQSPVDDGDSLLTPVPSSAPRH